MTVYVQRNGCFTMSKPPRYCFNICEETGDGSVSPLLACPNVCPEIRTPVIIIYLLSNSCSAISVGAAGLAVAAARCLPRLTRSPRFRLTANAPLGHHSDRSPLHCPLAVYLIREFESTMIQKSKPGTTVKVIPGFDVEHRRFELLTPTLPARQTVFSDFLQLSETLVFSRAPAFFLFRVLCRFY